jgi:hypothetical protein
MNIRKENAMTPAKRKHVKKVLLDAADFLDALVAAIRKRGIDCSDPELAALVDEARAHRNECIRAARN